MTNEQNRLVEQALENLHCRCHCDECRKTSEALCAEVRRLREIVGKPPVTADGVELLPGMTVWVAWNNIFWSPADAIYLGEGKWHEDWSDAETGVCVRWNDGSGRSLIDNERIYSSKQAAEAVRKDASS